MRVGLIVLCLMILSSCSKDENSKIEIITGSLIVNVQYSGGEPIKDAVVSIVPGNLNKTTDEFGKVTFENLEVGSYEISINLSEDAFDYTAEVEIQEDKIENINFQVLDPVKPISQTIDVQAALNDLYKKLKSSGIFDSYGYVSYWGDIGADVFKVSYSIQNAFYEADIYQLTASSSLTKNVWGEHYAIINNANSILRLMGDPEVTIINTGENEEVIAEVKFIRAMLYFNLVKIYGNPVVVTQSGYDFNNPAPFIQGGMGTYELIEEDLMYAERYLKLSSTANRASKSAAQALLGKVYLQMAGYPLLQTNKYSDALAQFKKVEQSYSLDTDYAKIFSVNNESSNEIIFKIDFDNNLDEVLGNYGYQWGPLNYISQDIFYLAKGFPESYLVTPGNGFNNPLFPLHVEDSRFHQNIATFKVEAGEKVNLEAIEDWRPYKYIQDTDIVLVRNDSPLDFPYLRYADVLLMLAEAENAINGPTTIAYDAVNKVRQRAYGNADNNLVLGLNQEEFLNAILRERRLELSFEGHRKDDLVRTQKLEEVIHQMNVDNDNFYKDFQSHEYIWPIPQTEIDLGNGEIVQNPGY